MKPLWTFLTSIRLTVYLLITSTFLVFFGTLDQVHDGIYVTQQRYFENVFVVWKFPQQFGGYDYLSWLHIPLPAGYLLGPLLILNLGAAHFRYYRKGTKKWGIALLHLGVVALLLGQLIAQVAQEDNYMWLAEGQSSNYLESFRDDELAVIDKTDPGHDRVYAWPTAAFAHKATTLRHPELPFAIEVKGYLLQRGDLRAEPRAAGPQSRDSPRVSPPSAIFRSRSNRLPMPMAIATALRPSLISGPPTASSAAGSFRMPSDPFPGAPFAFPPQTFVYQDRTYEIAMRHARTYLPATIKLEDFSHDRYPGTQIPVNFSSRVTIADEESHSERSNLIYMNHPMRLAGYTFYQASFANQDTMSMFQVVRNPGRWVPYIACIMISLGMLWQFL